MKLKFGDSKSIQLRDMAEYKNIEDRLINKVKCPFCKARALHSYDFNKNLKMIWWNFDCSLKCDNSFEAIEKNGGGFSRTCTNFNGKFL